MGLRWKVCGITSVADAAAAVEAGADAVGFIFYPQSPRAVGPETAAEIAAGLPAGVQRVGVFVDVLPDDMLAIADTVGLDVLQLSGDEPPAICEGLRLPAWKALRLPRNGSVVVAAAAESLAASYPHCTLLVDAHVEGLFGGTGRSANWRVAAQLASRRRLVLAGGLRPDNVAEAVAAVGPWGVDVASGVESAPGQKDPERLRRFAGALEPYR